MLYVALTVGPILAICMGSEETPPAGTNSQLKPVPLDCFEDIDDPYPSEEECIFPLLNQMVVRAATESITQKVEESSGTEVFPGTYYEVELYQVTAVNNSRMLVFMVSI
ncbi:hypothetical protein FOL47_005707 [Perkinsus chesapeaki]|uniref:Cystatin domain-containing protein n=1 Tax=Perkinsus chesapeaki TaxID=330153 RepID=A0A7J6LW36_PERCH|nr:hypothetical protein FOL47_005707 [Perkinsus chesapeaki]